MGSDRLRETMEEQRRVYQSLKEGEGKDLSGTTGRNNVGRFPWSETDRWQVCGFDSVLCASGRL